MTYPKTIHHHTNTTQHRAPQSQSQSYGASPTYPARDDLSKISPIIDNTATLRWFEPHSGEHVLHLMYDDSIGMHTINVLSGGRIVSFGLTRQQARDFIKVLENFSPRATTGTGVPLWLQLTNQLNRCVQWVEKLSERAKSRLHVR